jgi:hypothetical protein
VSRTAEATCSKHFHLRVKPFIGDRDWHDTQQLEELPNGIIVLTMDVSAIPDFIAWIGEFHNDCRVIAPPPCAPKSSKNAGKPPTKPVGPSCRSPDILSVLSGRPER